MNWIGGARSRIRAHPKQNKKIQKEYFERKRWNSVANSMKRPITAREQNQADKKSFSQDLAFFHRDSGLAHAPNSMTASGCYRVVNLSHNQAKAKIPQRATGQKVQHVELPLSPIETPSVLQLSSSPASLENQRLSQRSRLLPSSSGGFKYPRNVRQSVRDRKSSNMQSNSHSHPSTSIKPPSLSPLLSPASSHNSGVIDLFGMEIWKPQQSAHTASRYEIGISGEVAFKKTSGDERFACPEEQLSNSRDSSSFNSNTSIEPGIGSQDSLLRNDFSVRNGDILTSANHRHDCHKSFESEIGAMYESESNNRVYTCVPDGSFSAVDQGYYDGVAGVEFDGNTINLVGKHDNLKRVIDNQGRCYTSIETCKSAISVQEEIDADADFLEACSPQDIFSRKRQCHAKPSNDLGSFQASYDRVLGPQSFLPLTFSPKRPSQKGHENKTSSRKEVCSPRRLLQCMARPNDKGQRCRYRLVETGEKERRNRKALDKSRDIPSGSQTSDYRRLLDRKCHNRNGNSHRLSNDLIGTRPSNVERIAVSREETETIARKDGRNRTTSTASFFQPENVRSSVLEDNGHWSEERHPGHGQHTPQGNAGLIPAKLREDRLPMKRQVVRASQRSRAIEQYNPQGELIKVKYAGENSNDEDPLGCDAVGKTGITNEKEMCVDEGIATPSNENVCCDNGNITDVDKATTDHAGLQDSDLVAEVNPARLSLENTNSIIKNGTDRSCLNTPQNDMSCTTKKEFDEIKSARVVGLDGEECCRRGQETFKPRPSLPDENVASHNMDRFKSPTEQVGSCYPSSKTCLSNDENPTSSKLNVQEPFVDSSDKHDSFSHNEDYENGRKRTQFIQENSPQQKLNTSNNDISHPNTVAHTVKALTSTVVLKKTTPAFTNPPHSTIENETFSMAIIPNCSVDGNCTTSQIDLQRSQAFDKLKENDQIMKSSPQKTNTVSIGTQTTSKTYSDMACSPIPCPGQHTESEDSFSNALPLTESIGGCSLESKSLMMNFRPHLMLDQKEP